MSPGDFLPPNLPSRPDPAPPLSHPISSPPPPPAEPPPEWTPEAQGPPAPPAPRLAPVPPRPLGPGGPLADPAGDGRLDPVPPDVLAQWRAEGDAALRGPRRPLRRRRAVAGRSTARDLVLLWCLWLLGSWAVAMSLDSITPASRLMIFAAALGMIVVWPLLRLSQEVEVRGQRSEVRGQELGVRTQAPVPAPAAGEAQPAGEEPAANQKSGIRNQKPLYTALHVLRDWAVLNLIFQAVIWPLQLVPEWGREGGQWQELVSAFERSLERIVWLDLALAGWSLVIALLVAWGTRPGGWRRRALAMGLCLLVLVGEPLLMALLNIGSRLRAGGSLANLVDPVGARLAHQAAAGITPWCWIMRVSPVQALWGLTIDPVNWVAEPFASQVIAILAAGVAGWIGAGLILWRRRQVR